MSTDNPSAFPHNHAVYTGTSSDGVPQWLEGETGMSLLDYFAGKAMLGLLIGDATVERKANMTEKDVAFGAYEMAKAMLAERTARAKPTPIPSTLYPKQEMD